MAVTSKEESILANIATTLANVNGTGNYNLNLGSNIWRKFIHYGDMSSSDFPCVMIFDEDDVLYNPMTNVGYTTGRDPNNVVDGWIVALLGHVKVGSDSGREGLLQKELIKLRSDLIIAMLADQTRGGHALTTTLVASTKRVDWKKSVGGVVLSFAIKYDFFPTASSPST